MSRLNKKKQSKRTYRLSRIIFYALLLSFCAVNYGFVVGYSSNAQVILQELGHLPENDTIFSSIVNIAAFFGSAISGFYTMDKFGRKKTLFSSALIMLIGWFFMISVRLPYVVLNLNVYAMLISARVLTGLGLGMNAACVQVYVSEITLPELARVIMIFPTLFLTFGVFLCFLLSYLMLLIDIKVVGTVTPNPYNYSIGIMPLAGMLLSAYQLVAAIVVPESPVWINSNVKDTTERENTVTSIVSRAYGSDNDLDYFLKRGSEEPVMKASIWTLIRRRETIKAAALGVTVMILNNLTGVYAILYNATAILSSEASPDMFEASQAAIAVGATVFLGAVPGIFIGNYMSRRKPFVVGVLLLMVPLIVMALYYQLAWDIKALSIVMVVLYFLVYGSTWSFLPWVFMAEISQIEGKGIVVGLTTQANWLSGFVVTFAYTPLSNLISRGGMFWLFSGWCLLTAVFCFLFVPETKLADSMTIREFLNSGRTLAWSKAAKPKMPQTVEV